jgi:hypothetical protein
VHTWLEKEWAKLKKLMLLRLFALLVGCGVLVVIGLGTAIAELSLTSQAVLTASDSAFCRAATLAEEGQFQPATSINIPAGYKADFFVPSNGLNLPTDVVVRPNGDIVVSSGRSGYNVSSPVCRLLDQMVRCKHWSSPLGWSLRKHWYFRCAENLVSVNDEGERATLITPDGNNRPLITMISFQPPQTFVTFATG